MNSGGLAKAEPAWPGLPDSGLEDGQKAKSI